MRNVEKDGNGRKLQIVWKPKTADLWGSGAFMIYVDGVPFEKVSFPVEKVEGERYYQYKARCDKAYKEAGKYRDALILDHWADGFY